MKNSIHRVTDSQNELIGTAFCIDCDDISSTYLTCGHVFNRDASSILVDGRPAEIIDNHYEAGLDLATLEVKGVHATPLKIAVAGSASDATVEGFSKLNGIAKREKFGGIKVKADIESYPKNSGGSIDLLRLEADEDISSGYSGAPVVCNQTGLVVGVVFLQRHDRSGNYAISSKHILDIAPDCQICNVADNENDISLRTPITGEVRMEVEKYLNSKRDNCLKTFNTTPYLWVDPILHTASEQDSQRIETDSQIDLHDIVSKPRSIVIAGQKQYGLSSLAHHLVMKAWQQETPKFWLYLNADLLTPNTMLIKNTEADQLSQIELQAADVSCVVLDQFEVGADHSAKLLSKITSLYENVPVIVMLTISENAYGHLEPIGPQNREFEYLHLWALPRTGVRKIVASYNDARYIGDENSVVETLIKDMEMLNIPRTPLNCIIVLKTYEAEFEDNAVNRTDLIRRVLFLLFNVEDIPKYKTKPDLRDVEYILGYFSEVLLKSNTSFFTRAEFLKEGRRYCEDREISLEIEVIFDVLYANHIIVERGDKYKFRFLYWILYFAAHRMHHEPKFRDWILQDLNYSAYPELVEFYTGIDRRRDDALEVLIRDLELSIVKYRGDYDFPRVYEIYNHATWDPTEQQIESLQKELQEDVSNSNLPDSIKDEYADLGYDAARPYQQEVRSVLSDQSFCSMMRVVTAASVALRNSDYSSPSIRHELLSKISEGWQEFTNLLIVLTPILASDGYAKVEGAHFTVEEMKGLNEYARFQNLLYHIPFNLVGWYGDLFLSKRMGPMVFKQLEDEDRRFVKHILLLSILKKRPSGWSRVIENYIKTEQRNSFYLDDLLSHLRAEYRYGFMTPKGTEIAKKLIKMILVKHQLGVKVPSKKSIDKVSDSVLPNRFEN